MNAEQALNLYIDQNKVLGPIHMLEVDLNKKEISELKRLDNDGGVLATELYYKLKNCIPNAKDSELLRSFSAYERTGYCFRYFSRKKDKISEVMTHLNSIGYEYNIFRSCADDVWFYPGEFWADLSHTCLDYENDECICVLVWKYRKMMYPADLLKNQQNNMPTLRDNLVGIVLLNFEPENDIIQS